MNLFALLCLISCSWIFPISYSAHLSDIWYPARSRPLRNILQNLYDQAQMKYSTHLDASAIKALLVPHASYDYSGVVATSAYQNIVPGTFRRVIILAPSHHGSFQGVALPGSEYDSFKNIAGKILLDVKTLKALQKDSSGLFVRYQKMHETEHAIEIQIPLIQKYCGDCKIIPLLIGSVNNYQMHQIAQALREYVDDTTLLIVSSDLTHYGATFGYTPFISDVGRQIVALDDHLVQQIQKLDSAQLMALQHATGATVCGIYPIAILLMLLENYGSKIHSFVTGYDRSSGRDENPEHSVSYVGMVFSTQQPDTLPLTDRLTGYEKGILKGLAYSSLRNIFKDDSTQCAPQGILTEALRAYQGAFVTLYQKGHVLRGCVGTVQADRPLYETVCQVARAAATDDIRFQPLSEQELVDVTYSISVLTQPQKVASYQDIRVGIDGVILHDGAKSGLFLPQVALEFGWNLTTLLEQLSLKAGLDKESYKNKTAKFELFQTIDI